MDAKVAQLIQAGLAVPACPLALTAERKLDERRQRALVRYYATAGVGGVAVGVHTTQFAIRDPQHGLFSPVLELVAEELVELQQVRGRPIVRIGGIVGQTDQAMQEASRLRDLDYQLGLLSLAGHGDRNHDELIAHCRRVAEVIPIMGFYLQPAVGGCVLPYEFWRRFAEIENVVAIKIAPFNRYQTLDVVRAVADSGRDDIALYTGNDDNIVCDLLTEFIVPGSDGEKRRHIVGGLLGHWACWTRQAVWLFDECKRLRESNEPTVPKSMLTLGAQVTDANAAFFDAANAFHGCIPGIHEVLRRQGLMAGTWCLDPDEMLGNGQSHEIDRVYQAYPHLNDDVFVAEHLDEWLA